MNSSNDYLTECPFCGRHVMTSDLVETPVPGTTWCGECPVDWDAQESAYRAWQEYLMSDLIEA